ncbi:MAG: DUF1697 domain-containing protein [Gemmatimonadetes bacterium]|nr:DUF1697 domain-containing protein [Gemmatimonadota bacterium]
MRYVALLRAVNVAGHNKVAMKALRALLEDMGFERPQSLLQSGNLVFDAERRSPAKLEAELERGAAEQLGLFTDFFVRTTAEWHDIVAENPFPDAARDDPGHLLVLAAKDAASSTRVSALTKAISGREVIRAVGRQLYALYPDGVGRSKLTTALVERHLGTRVTGRNWNTVLKLDALVGT